MYIYTQFFGYGQIKNDIPITKKAKGIMKARKEGFVNQENGISQGK